MTLSPLEGLHFVKGVKGTAYKVGPVCANPGCNRFADHAHHIFRRSQLAGDYAWVELENQVYPNLCGLCVACHNDVTGDVGGHKAAIKLGVASGSYFWNIVHVEHGVVCYEHVGRLDPHPPTPQSLTEERALGQEDRVSEHCPFCGQTKRRRRDTAGPTTRRRRKTWTVSVPDDAEDGAEILDTFVDEVATLLGAGEWDERNRRYWALVHVLAWAMQQREQFAKDVRQAA